MRGLPVALANRLPELPEERRWLVDALWSEQAVGVIGGEPKACKSFLALELAVAVATGRRCLRRFPVPNPGRVLLYAAEDALHVVRQRLEGIAHASATHLDALDVHVITAPRLRLDVSTDVEQLDNTVAELKPRLLVLDPFVRLHTRDENASRDVAQLLAKLRDLQRLHQLAVVVVHHARKGGARRAGQALRGSSEFHAWVDSMLYMRRRGKRLTLSVEHRAAPAIDELQLNLNETDAGLALGIVEAEAVEDSAPVVAPQDRICQVLGQAAGPLALGELRSACRLRKATLCQQLTELVRTGVVVKNGRDYQLVATSAGSGSGSQRPIGTAGTGSRNHVSQNLGGG